MANRNKIKLKTLNAFFIKSDYELNREQLAERRKLLKKLKKNKRGY